jgi:hypothetical protein
MQAFTDLVGTTAVPAHAFDIAELTELTPTLDTATAAHDVAEQASEASGLLPSELYFNCSIIVPSELPAG